MTMVPMGVGAIHFVGIGGIGMSGIAEILQNLGYTVQGSDIGDSANVQRLRRQGVPVAIGHAAKNLGKARVVVVSSAIQPDNPELLAARDRRLPVVRRADMLAELMRLKRAIAVGGTHGKTTTTAMIAALLDAADLDPTVVNGGIINAYGTNARLGQGDWIVVEADESDGSFLRLPATIAVVTNIDPEHMEHYGSFDALRDAFHAFVERVPFYGFAALCIDHPEVQALYGRVTDRRVVTYGFSPQADVRALPPVAEADGEVFDVVIRAQERRGRAPAGAGAALAAGPAQRRQRAGRDRGRARAGHPRRGGPPHAVGPGGRQAPLHPHRHGRRRRHHRRLRPPSGRDQGRAAHRARPRPRAA